MKKTFIVSAIFTSFIFTGCLGFGDADPSDTTSSVVPGKLLYSNTEIQIQYPEAWELIEPSKYTSNVPEGTIVGFRNNIRNEIFTANVNVVKTGFENPITAEDFGKSALKASENKLLNFTQIASEKIGGDGIDGYTITFQGKKSATEPIIKFKQIFFIKGKTGFVATASYLPDEDTEVVKMTDEMLNSFSLK